MSIQKHFLAAAITTFAFVAPASAITVNIANGETWCDSADKLSSTASCSNPLADDDLGQTIGTDSITFAENGTMLGFLQDGDGLSSNWIDAATITLTSDSNVTFSLEAPTDAVFDGTFSFGNLVFTDPIVSMSNQSVTFSAAAGSYAFWFDATAPNQNIANTSEYSLTVSAVPLPAGGLLLLSALGGIAVAKRRRKMAAQLETF